MASGIGSSLRSFWHAMTSYDRHASHDSPYRTGSHVPLNQSKHAPLTSVATSGAMDSRQDLSSPYTDEVTSNGFIGSPNGVGSPTSPYKPGMRSSMVAQRQNSQDQGFEPVTPGEIQMQSFQDGLPPPPPVSHSWKRIDRWAEDNYPELYDQLSEGCTSNDLNELEHELDCSLPIEVRESLQCHDGQERGGRPTGIIFGCMLLDCEEIVQEWRNWKTVNEEYLQPHHSSRPPSRAQASSSSSTSHQGPNPYWRQELLDKQDSQPPRAVQKAYAHPGWIPLARDWGGNNLAVDLAPGPAGKWGQVIIFGRDYDCKVVVARSWSAFLAVVADDIGSPRVFVPEESGELKLREFKQQNVEPGYLDILRWRMDQKYGRRIPKKKAPMPNGAGMGPRRASPYGSPTDERGRSPARMPGRGPSSPRMSLPQPSPLSKVVEGVHNPVAVRGNGNIPQSLETKALERDVKPEKLVEAPTPTVVSAAEKHDNLLEVKPEEVPKVEPAVIDTLEPAKVEEAAKPTAQDELAVLEGGDEMKTVAI